MNPEKRRRVDSGTFDWSIITFHVANSEKTVYASIQTQSERLKSQIAPQRTRWSGKILVRTEAEDIHLALYDVFTFKILATLPIPFIPDVMVPYCKGSLLFNNNYGKQLYLCDNHMLQYTLVYESNDMIFCIRPLQNRTIAIGTVTGVRILNDNWTIIKSVSDEKTVDIIALKNGQIASLHGEFTNEMELIIWNAHWEQQFSFKQRNCDRLVELGSGVICGYGEEIVMLDLLTNEINTREACTYVLALKHGLRVEFYREKGTFQVYDGTEMVREECGYVIESVWDGGVAEVSPGVIAWQDKQNALMMYDVDRGVFVEGFPRPMFYGNARIRGFIFE
jgi:hypothetical protein